MLSLWKNMENPKEKGKFPYMEKLYIFVGCSIYVSVFLLLLVDLLRAVPGALVLYCFSAVFLRLC